MLRGITFPNGKTTRNISEVNSMLALNDFKYLSCSVIVNFHIREIPLLSFLLSVSTESSQ